MALLALGVAICTFAKVKSLNKYCHEMLFPNDLSDPLIFAPTPPAGQSFHLSPQGELYTKGITSVLLFSCFATFFIRPTFCYGFFRFSLS